MAFVLSRAPNGIDWQGATGTQITFGIGPADAPAVLYNIEYPLGTAKTPDQTGKVSFTIIAGTNTLDANINHILPHGISWHLTEYADSGSQTLIAALPDPSGVYPQDLAVEIIGK
jgi:hypothetical protein